MSLLTDRLKSVAADTRINRDELEKVLEAGTDASGAATAELISVFPKFADALEPEAAEELRLRESKLGVGFAPPPDLRKAPQLAKVWSEQTVLSATSNSKHPGVELVQRALMRIAVRENNAAFGLPKFGADGSFGAETTAAIKAFQRSARVNDDGVVGDVTLGQLELALKGRASELNDLRFSDNAELQGILDGTIPALGNGSSGEAVKIVQRVLVDLGYPLPRHGIDGGLGNETIYAVRQFQTNSGIPVTGKVDTATLQAMDKVAPAPGTRAILKPEYQRMLRDGVLPVTIGIGFDEDASHVWVQQEVKQGLVNRGFKSLKVASMSDAELLNLGIKPELVDRSARYYYKKVSFGGTSTPVLVKYVDPAVPNAKAQYADGMVKSGLVMYAGHARYGSGPDFDTKESTAGNFVIGVNAPGHKSGALEPAYDAHMREILKNVPNDLVNTSFEKAYQMMIFFGCTTQHYIDELRALPQNKGPQNFDTVTSNDILYWHKMPENIFTALDGILGHATKNAIEEQLFAINNVAFTFDGFGGQNA